MANEVQIPLDPNPLGPMEPIFFTGTITPLSQVYANFIRSKLFGKHVREALARGILIASIDANEAKEIARIANAKSDETAGRQDDLEERWKTVLAETTDGAEVIDARTGLRGTSWTTLKGRLDSMQDVEDKLNPVSNIFSIEHNQFGYPTVRVLALSHGLGVVPLESEVTGFGGSTTVSVNCDVEYLDRNSLVVKVPLAYAMTNPTIERISANEYLLVEGVNSLVVIVGNTAEANVETFITKTLKSDFTGKIAGSVLENGNIAKRYVGASIPTSPPSASEYTTQAAYDAIKKLEGTLSTQSTNSGVNASIPWHVIGFNILWILEQSFPSVFKNVTTVSEKVSIAKKIIVAIAPLAFAKGSGPSGNKISAQVYVANEWVGNSSNPTSSIAEIGFKQVNPVISPRYIHTDGFCHLVVFSEASNSATISIASIDYTSIELTARVSFPIY